jgi:methylthioribose-1-phosphate isomerase
MGIALGMAQAPDGDAGRAFDRISRRFAATRPTAVNLFWAIERMRRAFGRARGRSAEVVREMLRQEAIAIYHEDIASNRALGKYGAALLRARSTVLTHCNAGALATAGYGTALGVIRSAHENGKQVSVIATETRPFLQGARLTAWELKKDHVPVTLITDGMVGHFMKRGAINAVIVGADRAAANGDVANKIGTYQVAVLAARHRVPFYVAAPTSTIDLACPNGDAIPIEERNAREVTHVFERQIAPSGIKVMNPAFDVTPHGLVTAIITERGVVRAPYTKSLARLLGTETRDVRRRVSR